MMLNKSMVIFLSTLSLLVSLLFYPAESTTQNSVLAPPPGNSLDNPPPPPPNPDRNGGLDPNGFEGNSR